MSRLVLVRHGEAAAGWGDHLDPGLSEAGRAQAAEMAEALAPLGPLPIVVSPLRRTRETAAALEARWGTRATVDPRVGEVPSPTDDLDERAAWLRSVWPRAWGDEALAATEPWRAELLDALRSVTTDAVVVTHFVAICVAVGEATGDRSFACAMPDYCSRTVIDVDGGALRLVELGAQRATVVR